jgi:hypothetical protein
MPKILPHKDKRDLREVPCFDDLVSSRRVGLPRRRSGFCGSNPQ